MIELLLAALSLPLPQGELGELEVSKARMPRSVFMCRSADDKVGAIVDVQNDGNANYLSIHRTREPKSAFRAPIRRAAHSDRPDSYTMQLATEPSRDGASLTFQVQSVNHGPLAAWFDWGGPERLTGSCRNVPAPPAAERGAQ